MASTYKIYFTNWSGASTNFAFFSAVPVVNNNGGSPVYGNIIASQYVPADNGDTTFEIDVTQTYYAWTSVCPVDVSKLPGTNIVTKISNSKLATLGTKDAPGSTFKLIDNGGNPTFDPASTTFAAPDGTFQITSDANAFQPDQNFICGLGSVDGNGQRIPVATFAAQPNTVATIKPIVTFYIAQFSSQTGTVIDVSILSNKAAQIDFTGKGVNAAFVKQTQGGGFDVRYGSAKAMLELSKSSSSQKGPDNSSLSQNDLKILTDILQKLKPVPNTLYQCGFDWVDGLSEEAKAEAVNRAANAMNNPPGYIVDSVPSPPFTYPSFGIESPNTRDVVADRWSNVVANQLAAEARNPYTVDGNFANSKAHDTRTNGNQVTNKQSNGTNGLANNDLVQLLKGMRGLDVAAY